MSTPKKHSFKDVALTLSGNEVVCKLDGEVGYLPAGDGLDPTIKELHVITLSGGLIELIHDDPLWLPVRRAVSKYLRNLPVEKTPIDNDAA